MKLNLMLSLGLLSIPFMANANGVAQFTLITVLLLWSIPLSRSRGEI